MRIKSLVIIGFLVALTGCSVVRRPCPDLPTVCSYTREGTDFNRLGRVVLLEPYCSAADVQYSSDLTEALVESFKKRHLFSVDTLKREDPQWQNLQLRDADELDLQQIVKIKNNLNANAVIYGEITHYQPFPRMTVGLKLTMLDLRSGKILWGIEQVWDSTDKTVERRMKCFYEKCLASDYEPLNYRLLKVSPRAFRKFVASETAMTIPDQCGKCW